MMKIVILRDYLMYNYAMLYITNYLLFDIKILLFIILANNKFITFNKYEQNFWRKNNNKFFTEKKQPITINKEINQIVVRSIKIENSIEFVGFLVYF
jgi:hypothetical protein